MTIIHAANEASKLVDAVRNLAYYDWDEIFEHVPDGESTKKEIIDLLHRIKDHSGELYNFFK